MDETFNGWTNFATWRVNLEFFDGIDLTEWGDNVDDISEAIKEHVIETLESYGSGYALDYALAFVAHVNWREIALAHMEEETA